MGDAGRRLLARRDHLRAADRAASGGTGDEIGALNDTAGPHASLLHGVLARAMDQDPARRYPTALAFAAALGSGGARLVRHAGRRADGVAVRGRSDRRQSRSDSAGEGEHSARLNPRKNRSPPRRPS